MTDEGNGNRDADGLVAAPSCIGDVCTEKRDDENPSLRVRFSEIASSTRRDLPESVECTNTGGGLLT